MIPLPSKDPTSPIAMADWLEVVALTSPDHNSSKGDLETALRRGSYAELLTDEYIEVAILETFGEIERRGEAAREAYPFAVTSSLIQPVSSDLEQFSPYIFCLLLSREGLPDTAKTPKLFERLAQFAAEQYVRGASLGFGHPRTELPTSFELAISHLCSDIGEGVGFRNQPTLDRKDDTLDIVAWADFPDSLPSKIIVFGQCAAGKDWEAKAGELNPSTFTSQWFQVIPTHMPFKSFFIPHRIDRLKWDFISRKAGIVFDRCRIAYWAHHARGDYSVFANWIKEHPPRVQ